MAKNYTARAAKRQRVQAKHAGFFKFSTSQ